MKITKKKEVVTEEIEVKPGTYYFDSGLRSYKMSFGETDKDGYTKYKLETLNSFANVYSIKINEDVCDLEDIPFEFKQFILGSAGRKITKEEFEEEREDILKRITDKVKSAQ